MKWNKFRLKTTTESEDIVSSMLMDLGIQGIEIEDKIPLTQSDKEQMFVDTFRRLKQMTVLRTLVFIWKRTRTKKKFLTNVKKNWKRCGIYECGGVYH